MDESPRSVPDEVGEVAGQLRIGVGMLIRKLRQAPQEGELSFPEALALSRLDQGGASTGSALARAERISPQSMGTTLAELERRGLVAREKDPGDGRRIVLSITEAGRRLVHDRRGARTALIARTLEAGFTRAELEQLRAAAPLLQRLAEKL